MMPMLFSASTAEPNFNFGHLVTGNNAKKECTRCGTCCLKGGPALHYEDRVLLSKNFLTLEHLVTIRKGEPVFSPEAEAPEPATSEFLKIKGKGNEWSCFFFDKENAACAIYSHRPLECSLLKCWETADIEKAAGRNLISRHDIIAPNDPVLPFIKEHDDACSLQNLDRLLSALNKENSRQQALRDLTALVNTDMAIRAHACARFRFSLELELFFFGRPLFVLLDQFGIETRQENGGCSLSLASSMTSAKLVKRM